MVLKRETDVENRVATCDALSTHGGGEFGEGHGVCEAIQCRLGYGFKMVGKRVRRIDPPTNGDDSGEIAHRFTDRILVPIRDWRADEDVIFTCRTGKRELKNREKRAEKRGPMADSKCLRTADQLRRNHGNPAP